VALFAPLISKVSYLLDTVFKKPAREESITDDVLYLND
jgi:hypothetical protein